VTQKSSSVGVSSRCRSPTPFSKYVITQSSSSHPLTPHHPHQHHHAPQPLCVSVDARRRLHAPLPPSPGTADPADCDKRRPTGPPNVDGDHLDVDSDYLDVDGDHLEEIYSDDDDDSSIPDDASIGDGKPDGSGGRAAAFGGERSASSPAAVPGPGSYGGGGGGGYGGKRKKKTRTVFSRSQVRYDLICL